MTHALNIKILATTLIVANSSECQIHMSGDEYLVSRRNGVMLHFAFKLAVTPLGADLTLCMFSSSSSDSTIMFLIFPGAT